MQSFRDVAVSGPILQHPVAACSPPQMKTHFNSGYPSPPSSGRADREGAEGHHGGEVEEGQRPSQGYAYAYAQVSGHGKEAALNSIDGEEAVHRDNEEPDLDEEERFDDEGSEGEGHEDDNDDGDEDDDITVTSHTIRSSTIRSTTTPESVLQEAEEELTTRPAAMTKYRRPIRDTPRNPFLEGGPADLGLGGPNAAARSRRTQGPAAVMRERGKMTYVFRGQRVTYADPYASDSDDDGTGPSTRACLLDKLQPRLLFPSVGKPSISGSAQQQALRKGVAAFGGGEMKKMGGSRPSLEMMAERQQARSSGQHRSKFSSSSSSSSSARVDLMTSKIGHSSSWSDDADDEEEGEEEADFDEEDEDEEEEEEDGVQVSASLYGNEEGCKGASATFPLRVAHEDDDYDDDDDQEMTEEQDDNPFMERTIVSRQQGNTRNATFVDRLYRAQQIASLNRQSTTTTSGVVRSSSRNDMNRYNPYNKQQSQIHYRSHATSQR